MNTYQRYIKALLGCAALLLLFMVVPALAEDVPMPPVQLQVAGAAPLPGDPFTFLLTGQNGAPMPAGSSGSTKQMVLYGQNTANFGTLTGLTIGEYRYTVTQLYGGDSSYEYDQRTYTMLVQVTWKNQVGGETAHSITLFTIENGEQTKVNTQPAAFLFVNTHADLSTPTPSPIPTPTFAPTPTPTVIPTPTPTVTPVPAYTPVTDALTVRKAVSGSTGATETFSFKLEADNPTNPMPDGSVNGRKYLSMMGSGSADFGTMRFTQPGVYNYTVTESIGSSAGYRYDYTLYLINYRVTLNQQTNALSLTKTVTYAGNTGASTDDILFNNQFTATVTPTPLITPTPTMTATVTPTPTPTQNATPTPSIPLNPVVASPLDIGKRVVGDIPSSAREFQFVLSADGSAPMPSGSQQGQKTVSILGAGQASFGAITYTQPGIYNYTVREVLQSATGYTFDYAMYLVSVAVTADYSTGNLLVSRRITLAGGNGTAISEILFTNQYLSGTGTETPVPPTATPTDSTATPTSPTATPTGGTATPTGGTATPTGGTATPTGGTATPTPIPNPVSVDPPISKRVVGDTPSQASIFQFELRADHSSNPMPDGASGGVLRVQRTGAGAVEFGDIRFTREGIYNYTVIEIIQTTQGYRYDYSMYLMSITVTNENGQLKATKSIKLTGGDGAPLYDMEFRNQYTATSATTTPNPSTPTPTPIITPDPSGNVPTPTPTFAPTTPTPSPTPTPIITPDPSGNVPTPTPTFAPTTPTPSPTPTPIITPDPSGNVPTPTPTFAPATPTPSPTPTPIITPDPSGNVPTPTPTFAPTTPTPSPTPTPIITPDPSGNVPTPTPTFAPATPTPSPTPTPMITPDPSGNVPTPTPTFAPTTPTPTPGSNTPVPNAVVVTDPPVRKAIIGGTPDKDTLFHFTLRADNPTNPMPAGSANGVKTVSLAGEGEVEFGDITYTQAGIYNYTITEVRESAQGYTYDAALYLMSVNVTNVNGQLQAARTILLAGGNGQNVNEVLFSNAYLEPGTTATPTPLPTNTPTPGVTPTPAPITLNLPIRKAITGDTPSVSQAFQFRIEADKEDTPMPSGADNGVLTLTINGSGSISMGNITFTRAGEYYYTITEVIGTAAGYQYDNTEYILRVIVREVNGVLVPEATIVATGTGTVSSVVFTNHYTNPAVPTPTPGGPTPTPPPGPVTGDLHEEIPLWILLGIGAIGMALSILLRKRSGKKGL